jgi:Zn-dependent protease with chaperone function
MMTDEQLAAVSSKAEEQAKTHPARYLRKMQCLLLLGDLYLALITGLLLALQVGPLFFIVQELRTTGQIGWQTVLAIPVLIWAIWLTRKLLLMKGGRKPSAGIPLTRQQAPELFALIETLRGQVDALPIHQVLITEIFHASLEQLPRFGVFGWHQNTILLGLPLFKCLTVEQLKVIVVHELGHLAKRHNKMTRHGHRQMLRWTGLADTMGDDPHGYLFKHFLEWFIAYVGAYAGPMVRMSEHEADAFSVRLVSHEAAVETLCVSNVIDRYLEEYYWPLVRGLANELPEPIAPYQIMGQNLAAEVSTAVAMRWLALDMAHKTSLTETHPSLADRLQALQATPRIVLAAAGQNAEGLLGSALQPLTEQMDREWQDKNRAWWVERYQRVQNDRCQFAELNAAVARGAVLTVEEAYQRARLTWSVGRNEEETLQQLLALYHREPQHPLASFGLGAWLLSRYNPEDEYDAEDGYALLEQTMRLDARFTARCCEMLREYCLEHGREETAQHWDEKLKAALQQEEEAAKQEHS